jgi:hypothetical protein
MAPCLQQLWAVLLVGLSAQQPPADTDGRGAFGRRQGGVLTLADEADADVALRNTSSVDSGILFDTAEQKSAFRKSWWRIDWHGDSEWKVCKGPRCRERGVQSTDAALRNINESTYMPCTASGSSRKRMALALRGGAFRQGQNSEMDRCGEGTYEVQKTMAESIQKHVIQVFENRGFEVDVFITVRPGEVEDRLPCCNASHTN